MVMEQEEATRLLPKELLCNRSGGGGWRCKNPKLQGEKLCQHDFLQDLAKSKIGEMGFKKKVKRTRESRETSSTSNESLYNDDEKQEESPQTPETQQPQQSQIPNEDNKSEEEEVQDNKVRGDMISFWNDDDEKQDETPQIPQTQQSQTPNDEKKSEEEDVQDNKVRGDMISFWNDDDEKQEETPQIPQTQQPQTLNEEKKIEEEVQDNKVRGDMISFWNDKWNGEKSLREEFPRLYDVSNNQLGSIDSHIYRDGEISSWDLGFRRRFKDWEVELVPSLLERIGEPPRLKANEDMHFWALYQSKPSLVASNRTKASTREKSLLRDHDKATSCAIKRANEVQANLDHGFPSFLKSLKPTNIISSKLGLPSHFCRAYFPKQKVVLTLINENQEQYRVVYHGRIYRFGVGWKAFSIANKLMEGDALIFQLVKPTEFQVYIARAHSVDKTDGNIGLSDVDALQERLKSGKPTKPSEDTTKRNQKTLSLAAIMQREGDSGHRCEDIVSDVLGRNKILSTTDEFKNVESLESFTIAVNGLIIDSELSEQARRKYYELCCSQKAFLHDNLLDAINIKMAAGVISQTIEIADEIRGSKFSTFLEEFTKWDTNLEAYELLGMNVGFLRARVKKLVSLVCESKDGVDSKRCGEVIAERNDVMQKIETLKAKLVALKLACKMFDTEIETLEVKAKHYELEFQAEVDAPW